MNDRAVYLDASALVKLVVIESETRALLSYLADHDPHITSRIAAVEVGRAAVRRGGVAQERLDAVFTRIDFKEFDLEVASRAARLSPPGLRNLDAIHLASALGIPSLAALVTYDQRLSEAAQGLGLETVAPA